MPEFLRDPLWQFVGAILTALAIIATIVLFFMQRKRKALEYKIISRTAVLSAAEEIAGKLQILFQGEPVKKVHLLVIKLINTGNMPITSGDYEREVSLKFTYIEKILSAEISETTPSNLSAEIYLKDKNIVLNPILLNAGDSITIKILIGGYSGKLEIEGRIIGVKSIEKITESKGWSLLFMIVGLCGILPISCIFGLNFAKKALPSPLFTFLYVVAFCVYIYGINMYIEAKRKNNV